MKHIDWNNVKEAGTSLKADGYVCGITTVEDVPEREYLKFEFDVVEGQFKNYYRELCESKGFWGGSFVKSYKQSAQGFFKKMLTAFEKSNSNFKFVDDEKVFKGKYIGIVLGEEEYKKNDGTIGTRLYANEFLPVEAIRNGRYKVPEPKTLNGKPAVKTDDIEEIGADDDEVKLPWD